jgi:hypothetical protein
MNVIMEYILKIVVTLAVLVAIYYESWEFWGHHTKLRA